MQIIVSFIGVSVYLLILLLLVLYFVGKNKGLSFLEWFILSNGLLSGVSFGFVIWSSFTGRNPYNRVDVILKYSNSDIFIYLTLNLILIISVIFGWYIYSYFYKETSSKEINERRQSRIIYLMAWYLLLVSVISFYIYSRSYGGFLGLIDYSMAIRSSSSGINNPFSFFKVFGNFSFVSSFLFYGLKVNLEKNKKIRFINLGFNLSVLFSIYVLYTKAGRVGLAIYILTFILGYILYNSKTFTQYLRRVCLFIMMSIILIISSDAVFGNKSETSIIALLSKEMSFPLLNFKYHYGLSDADYRYFEDIVNMPLFIFPEKLWSGIFNVETISSINTYLITGYRKGEADVTGTVPIDMLTLGYLQCSIIGIVLLGLLWGFFLHFVEKLTLKIMNKGVYSVIYAYIILNVILLNVYYADPEHFISRNFNLIIVFPILMFFTKYKIKLR